MSSSIPPPSPPLYYRPFPTRKLRDLPTALPTFDSYPPLPSPRSLDFVPGYNLTTHIIPASYPRQSFLEPRRYPHLEAVQFIPPPPEEKFKRQAWAFDTGTKLRGKQAALLKLRTENRSEVKDPQELTGPVLWNAVNRYARIGAPKDQKAIGITVVLSHGNGSHKEVWEPTIKHLISLCDRPSSGIHIDEVWSIDTVNCGDSALLNEKYLGDIAGDWIDHARDILNLVENFIPEGPFVATTQPLPVHLDRVSSECSSRRQKFGFHDRNVVAIGHSIGGCVIANAACASPNIFHSITLVDPIISPDSEGNRRPDRLVMGALLRRQSWSSRDEAKALFLQSPFFNVWTSEALDVYVKYGLVDIPPSEGGGARLKASRFQEAVGFADDNFEKETYEILRELDEKVKIKWIMAREPVYEQIVELTQATVWRRPVNSSNVKVNSSHQIPTEAPLELAKEALYSWQDMYADTIRAKL
ncbi:hypothetical protein BS47DRAFT_1397676 [Hydnum rufescens UP504]|uniref:AB hydrolase-1 domain-containing protein n=1 Tax=Hydnum rufescens UP504 TaxID=1448309 RepID=A0A9P6ANM4_9AGAM|nr:hypothetical protein BS47DRAFT_1397676 [Hydnum rufescens UP504]